MRTTPPTCSRFSLPDGGVAHNAGTLNSMPDQALVILPFGFDGADTTINGTQMRFDDNDSGKFTYITPRFAGFQIGLSFIPNFENNGGDNNNSISRIGNAGGPGNTTAPANLNSSSGIKDGYAAGLNFKEKFGDFGVDASLGYLFGDVPSVAGSSNLQVAGAGLRLSFAGFDVGGSYVWSNGDKASSPFAGGVSNESYDGYGYDVGIAYAIGPYKIGLAYLTGESEGLRANDSKQYADYIVLSGTYRLGPGVSIIGGVYGFDLDGEDGVAGANQIEKNDGWGAVAGVTLSF